MDAVGTILSLLWKTLLFMLLSIIFLPSFFIVTYLTDVWSKMLSELFGV